MRAGFVGIILLLSPLAPAGAQTSPGDKGGERIEKINGKKLDEWREVIKKGGKGGDASQRTTAIVAICQFGEDASRAIDDLIYVMDNDPDVSPRAKAVHAMRFIDVDESQVKRVVNALARRVGRRSTGERTESQVVVRLEALYALRRFTADAAPALDELISATTDTGSWELRHQAVGNLWRIAVEDRANKAGPTAGLDTKVYNALLKVALARDATHEVKLEAVSGLAFMGKPGDPEVLKHLVDTLELILRGPSAGVPTPDTLRMRQVWALAALANLGTNPGGATKAPLTRLAGYLKKDHPLDIRRQAAAAMGVLGKSAAKQLPALIAMLDDDEPLAVAGACQALLAVAEKNDEKVIDKLLELIEYRKTPVVVTALNTLLGMKANSKKVMEALQKQLDRRDDKIEKSLQAYIDAVKKELEKAGKKP